MKTLPCLVYFLTWLILSMVVSLSTRGAPIIVASNIGNPDAGFFTGFGPATLATNGFTTGAMPAVLNAATLRLGGQIGPAQFHASIHSDNGGIPGPFVGSFDNQPTTFATANLTFFTHTPLAANTPYWLVVTTLTGFGSWQQVTGTGIGPWTIGGINFSPDNGMTWGRPLTTRANEFSLSATLVPEPTILAMLGSAALAMPLLTRRAKSRKPLQVFGAD